MALDTMYPPQVNSPATSLSGTFVYTDTSMPVTDGTVLLVGTNIVTVGEGNTAGTFEYTGKSGNTLTGVSYVEGYQGTWPAGTVVARRISAKDFTAIQANLNKVYDHGNLTGLSDNDHPQYIKHKVDTSQAEHDFMVANSSTTFGNLPPVSVKQVLGTDGLRSFWLDFFHGVYQPSTGGAPATTFQYELSTSKIYINAFKFATDVDQHIQALWLPPANFTGKIKVQFFWTTGNTSGNVVWGVKTRTPADDAPLDGNWSTGVTVTDAWLGSLDCHMSPETTLTAISGYDDGQPVWFDFYRNGANASDTIDTDVYLIGVKVIYEINHLDG